MIKIELNLLGHFNSPLPIHYRHWATINNRHNYQSNHILNHKNIKKCLKTERMFHFSTLLRQNVT